MPLTEGGELAGHVSFESLSCMALSVAAASILGIWFRQITSTHFSDEDIINHRRLFPFSELKGVFLCMLYFANGLGFVLFHRYFVIQG